MIVFSFNNNSQSSEQWHQRFGAHFSHCSQHVSSRIYFKHCFGCNSTCESSTLIWKSSREPLTDLLPRGHRGAEWIHPRFLFLCVNLGHVAAVRDGPHGRVACHVYPSLRLGCTPRADPNPPAGNPASSRTLLIRTLILLEFLRNDPGWAFRDHKARI